MFTLSKILNRPSTKTKTSENQIIDMLEMLVKQSKEMVTNMNKDDKEDFSAAIDNCYKT